MKNWIEEEEDKKRIKENEQKLIDQFMQKVDNNLQKFYSLCKRVNNLRPNALVISRLKVECNNRYYIEKDFFEDSNIIKDYIQGARGIRFEFLAVDKVKIIVSLTKHSHKRGTYSPGIYEDGYYFEPTRYGASDDVSRIDFIHKYILFEDLINWKEDQMVKVIDYLLLDSESIILPGAGLIQEEYYTRAKKERDVVYELLSKEYDKLIKLKKFQFGRSAERKNEQINNQMSIVTKLRTQNNKLNEYMEGLLL